MDEKIKKQLAKLATLSADELDALEAQLLETADLEDTSDANLALLGEVVEAKNAIKAERTTREASENERQAKLEALKAQLEDKEDEQPEDENKETEEETDDAAEGEVVEIKTEVEIEEKEAVAAAAKVEVPKPGTLRKRVSVKQQTPTVPSVGFTASVSSGQIRDGDPIDNEKLGQMFAERINGGWKGPSQSEQRLNVAHMDWGHVYPEDRILDGGSRDAQIRSIQAAGLKSTPEALTAAGGLCAPLTPYYDLADVSQAGRPVRDALTQFNASRGGITFVPPSQLLDFTGALTNYTVANDEDSVAKNCLDMLCEDAESVNTRAVVQCLTFGNFRSRTFPEQQAEHVAKTQSAHARFAERLLLDSIHTASTAVTVGEILGTVRNYFAAMDLAADAYRNRHRMAKDATLQVISPLWLKSQMQADLLRQGPGDNTYAISDAFIQSIFASRNLSNTWSYESRSGSGQDFATQGVGALIGWPDSVTSYLFHPGAFLFLDGGTLDLGITRDSTLNSTNDFQIFAETFEGVAFVGLESLAVSIDICPSGKSSLGDDVDPCTSGS